MIPNEAIIEDTYQFNILKTIIKYQLFIHLAKGQVLYVPHYLRFYRSHIHRSKVERGWSGAGPGEHNKDRDSVMQDEF